MDKVPPATIAARLYRTFRGLLMLAVVPEVCFAHQGFCRHEFGISLVKNMSKHLAPIWVETVPTTLVFLSLLLSVCLDMQSLPPLEPDEKNFLEQDSCIGKHIIVPHIPMLTATSRWKVGLAGRRQGKVG